MLYVFQGVGFDAGNLRSSECLLKWEEKVFHELMDYFLFCLNHCLVGPVMVEGNIKHLSSGLMLWAIIRVLNIPK